MSMDMLSIIYLKNMPEILEITQTLKVPFAPIKTLHCNSGHLRSPDHAFGLHVPVNTKAWNQSWLEQNEFSFHFI